MYIKQPPKQKLINHNETPKFQRGKPLKSRVKTTGLLEPLKIHYHQNQSNTRSSLDYTRGIQNHHTLGNKHIKMYGIKITQREEIYHQNAAVQNRMKTRPPDLKTTIQPSKTFVQLLRRCCQNIKTIRPFNLRETNVFCNRFLKSEKGEMFLSLCSLFSLLSVLFQKMATALFFFSSTAGQDTHTNK